MGDKPQCPTWVGCKWCQPAALQAKKITVLALLSWEVKCTYISALFPSKQEKSVHHPRGAGGVLSPATDLSCSEMCSAHFCIALSAIGKPSLLLGFPQAGDAKKIQKWGGGGIKKNKQKAYGNRGGKPTTAAVVIQEEKAQACGCKARRTQQPCDGTLSSCCCIAPASITPATEPTPIAPCNTKKGEKKKRFLITERCWGVLPRHATALPPSAAASELEKAQARLTPTSHPSRGTTRCFPPRPKPPPAGASKQIDQKEPTVSTQSA